MNTYFRKIYEDENVIKIEYLIDDLLKQSGIIVCDKKTKVFSVFLSASGCGEWENNRSILRIKDYYEKYGDIPKEAVGVIVT